MRGMCMSKRKPQRQETPAERFNRVTAAVMNRQRKRKALLAKQKLASTSGASVNQSSPSKAA